MTEGKNTESRQPGDGTQESGTIPPTDTVSFPPLPSRASSPCDETTQKGAPSSPSDLYAPCSTPNAPRPHTPRLRSAAENAEDGALEQTAHAAERAIGIEERGKQAFSQVAYVSSSQKTFMKRKGRTSEELLQRYRDDACNSFPTYGTSKDGVPVPDPMSTKNRRLLNGGLTGGINTLQRGSDVSSKRHINESPRLAKRRKTQPEAAATEASAQAAFTTQSFAPIPTSSSLSPQTPTLVDLTNSQQPADVEAASNRSTHSLNSTANGNEFKNVEKAHNGLSKKSGTRPRPRPRRLQVRESKKPEGYDCDVEDEIGQDQPVLDKRARRDSREGPRKAAWRRPQRRTAEEITEVSEDDELAIQTGRSRRAQDDISDGDGTSLNGATANRTRGDMTKVNFGQSTANPKDAVLQSEQSQPVIPKDFVLTVMRAVSGKDTFEAKKPEDCILLKIGQDSRSLIAFDPAGERFSKSGWLDVKLMFCTKIYFSTTGAQFAVVWRSSTAQIGGLLVLEFAGPGDAHTLGLWAETKVNSFPTQRTDCSSKDSQYLQKIYDKQKAAADKWEDRKDSQPDDIKLLEHKEASKTKADATSVPWSQSKPSPVRNPLLRGNMRAEDPSHSSNPESKTSAYFAPTHYNSATEPQQTKDLRPREARNTASKRVHESPLSIFKRKSPSPVTWIQQNPDWDKIWNEKPLIFPATGKNRSSVYRDDISRLEEGEYLNDNLIGFYLRYLQVHLEKEKKSISERIYIMNTYFYPKLTDVKAGRGINYEGVKSWTAKVDLFSYDYIVVPVNESAHWYLAIVCNPSKLLKTNDGEPKIQNVKPLDETKEEPKENAQEKLGAISSEEEGMVSTVGEQVEQMSLEESKPIEEEKKEEPRPGKKEKGQPAKQRQSRKSTGIAGRKQDPTEARVITLDSLGVGHSPTCGNLKAYLVREAKDKRSMEVEPPGTFGLTAKNIPEQEDHASCGAFLLGYMREFLKDPDGVVTKLVRKERLEWDITSPAMRSELRTIIIEQRKMQNATLAAERIAKRKSTGQPLAPGKLPSEGQESEPATPRTPQHVVDVPKNPSSTVKGSPAIGRLPPHNRSSPPAKTKPSDATPLLAEPESATHDRPVTEIEKATDVPRVVDVEQASELGIIEQAATDPQEQHDTACEPGSAVDHAISSGRTNLPTNHECDVIRALVDNLDEQPATPKRTAWHTGTSGGVQLRTSPRHSKTKAVEANESSKMLPALKPSPAQSSAQKASGSRGSNKKLGNSQMMLGPLESSPAQSAGHKKAGLRGPKRKLSNSEEMLCNLSSPPPKAARKDEKYGPQPPKGDSPSQQLLAELRSPSESTQGEGSTSRSDVKMQDSIIIEDPESPKTPPRTLTKTPTQKSHYFRSRSSPQSVREKRNLSLQEQKVRSSVITSIEQDSETVDLTVN
ncbi:sentrin-specific protease [Colletotrichum orchidophilum]|uniref:Sentrin-specific protease n=1 Tax=Colletotrichum orchidophilum TaxID=1209926 RepID=A0A1G4AU85_9PEZI|nr:sentrin-specific protease [Colletotrichum orchidophilum]OHE92656.1 sentrin-specific protease [Colletotrichum orchidophilum]